jgi:predicted nucleic acid-binding protein
MQSFVLDVSACMPWCCEDEMTPASEEMLEWARRGSELHVPSIWAWELLNAVGVVIKRQRVPADRGREFPVQLSTLNFRIDRAPQVTDFPRLHELATKYRLTSYDVAYLDLAKRFSLPLATRDSDLEKAAASESIVVLSK